MNFSLKCTFFINLKFNLVFRTKKLTTTNVAIFVCLENFSSLATCYLVMKFSDESFSELFLMRKTKIMSINLFLIFSTIIIISPPIITTIIKITLQQHATKQDKKRQKRIFTSSRSNCATHKKKLFFMLFLSIFYYYFYFSFFFATYQIQQLLFLSFLLFYFFRKQEQLIIRCIKFPPQLTYALLYIHTLILILK